jgi:hypothetical protein
MIRDVLVCPLNYDHQQRGLLQAFRGIFGDDCATTFDYLELWRTGACPPDRINAALVDEARGHRYGPLRDQPPDWIWLQLQETEIITAETLLRIREARPKTVITHWTGDMRTEVSPYLASICKATHATLASSTGQLAAFRAAGAPRAEYLQIGLDWEEDVQGLPAWEPRFRVPDVVFCGNFYGDRFPEGSAERLGAIRALRDAGIDVGVVGKGWPADIPVAGECGVKQQHHVYRAAKVALSISHFSSVANYYSDRQLIAMASGTPVVARWVPGMDEEFDCDNDTDDWPCLFYYGNDDLGELVDSVRHLLADPERRKRMGRSGRAVVMRRHTWFHRILSVLPLVEEIQAGLPVS